MNKTFRWFCIHATAVAAFFLGSLAEVLGQSEQPGLLLDLDAVSYTHLTLPTILLV